VNTIPKPPLRRLFLGQALVALLIFAVILPVNRIQSYSFLLGCLVQLSGSLYFAWQAFKYSGAKQTKSMVQSMYRGEAGKIVLSGALFAMVFTMVKPVSAAFVFIGFLLMQAMQIVLVARILK
jgi:ATP synthase protein I